MSFEGLSCESVHYDLFYIGGRIVELSRKVLIISVGKSASLSNSFLSISYIQNDRMAMNIVSMGQLGLIKLARS